VIDQAHQAALVDIRARGPAVRSLRKTT
jgi:hypothetical protein